jgi:hypothetical protein
MLLRTLSPHYPTRKQALRNGVATEAGAQRAVGHAPNKPINSSGHRVGLLHRPGYGSLDVPHPIDRWTVHLAIVGRHPAVGAVYKTL